MLISEVFEQGFKGASDLSFGKDMDKNQVADHDDGSPGHKGIKGLPLAFLQSEQLLAVTEIHFNSPPAGIVIGNFRYLNFGLCA